MKQMWSSKYNVKPKNQRKATTVKLRPLRQALVQARTLWMNIITSKSAELGGQELRIWIIGIWLPHVQEHKDNWRWGVSQWRTQAWISVIQLSSLRYRRLGHAIREYIVIWLSNPCISLSFALLQWFSAEPAVKCILPNVMPTLQT